MAVSIKKPGVDITQVVQGTPVVPSVPQLPACVIGPCFEVVDALVASAPNPSAKVDVTYRQLPLTVSYDALPTNHANIEDVVVNSDSVSVVLADNAGARGAISLPRTVPEAFLAEYNHASRPAFIIDYSRVLSRNANAWPAGTLNIDVNGAISQINFTGTETLSGVVARFTNAGLDAHSYTLSGADDSLFVEYGTSFSSNTATLISISLPVATANIGSDNSIKLFRLGSAVSTYLQKLIGNLDGGVDHKVKGSGLSTDLNDSAKVVFSSGVYYRGDLSAPGGDASSEQAIWTDANSQGPSPAAVHPALIVDDTNLDVSSDWTAARILLRKKYDKSGTQISTNLGVLPSTPIRTGDALYINGSQVGVVLSLSDSFVRVGSVDTANSIYGSDGRIIAQRYTPASLPSRLSARNAYFKALSFDSSESRTAASASFNLKVLDPAMVNAAPASVSLRYKSLDTDDNLSLQVAGTQLVVTVTRGSGSIDTVIPFQDNIEEATDLLAQIVNADPQGFSVALHANGKGVELSTTDYGADVSISVNSVASGSTATGRFHVDADAVEPVLIGEDTTLTASGKDAKLAALDPTGERGVIFFDDNPEGFEFTGRSASVYDLVDDINTAVGLNVASFVASTNTLTVSSPTQGRVSAVSFSDDSAYKIFNVADWQAASSRGTGRPLQSLRVGIAGFTIGSSIFRDVRTGRPLRRSGVLATPYVGYTGLRLDVSTSPLSSEPAPVIVSSISDITNNFSPVDERNPLGLGLFYALSNGGEGISVYGIGVDDVNPSEPDGTLEAYARAADLLRSQPVYAIAPLSPREDVIGLFDAHVTNMSLPENRSERVLIAAPKNPTRTADTAVFSTSAASAVGVVNVVDVGDAITDLLVAQGIDASDNAVLPESLGVFLSITISGSSRSYSVRRVSGTRVTVATSGLENVDGFYSTTPILSSESFSGVAASISIRGKELRIAGTRMLNRQLFAETVRDRAQSYNNRRQLRIFPDRFTAVLRGVSTSIPSHFAAAALAGDTASRAPQQPITRTSLVGFTGSVAPTLENTHLDIISAGSAPLLMDGGAAPEFRMQSTTAPDVIEDREFSIVKAVDSFAKRVRNALTASVGQFNVTQGYMDTLQIALDAICRSSVESGLLAAASVDTIVQDTDSPDTILVSVNVAPLVPANYIKLTIVI